MAQIGNYIHYHTENYKRFGTTQDGPSDYGDASGSLNKQISDMKSLAKQLHKKYRNGKMIELERFMNSIFYPQPGGGRSPTEEQQFQQMRAYVDAEFEKMFNGFKVNWEQGLSVYTSGTRSVSEGTKVGSLTKIRNQLDSALQRVSGAKTIAKIEAAQRAIDQALAELQSMNVTNPRVTIGKNLKDSTNLIETINSALRATMYNNAAVGYVFELALATFSGQVSDRASQISADLVNEAMRGAARSNPLINIQEIDKTFFDEELFGGLINRNTQSNLGVWQRTPDGTGFQFTAPTQDKLDVALSFDGEMYNITAKNYANILARDIHIVSGTPLLSMLLGNDPNFVNHYLNITASVPGDTSHMTLAHEAMKLTILLRSLTGIGSSAAGSTADVLVVNDRASKHIYIRSIGELVSQIAMRLDQIDNYMKIHGLGSDGSLNIKNDFVGAGLSDENARVRITKLLASLQNKKISVSLKGTALTALPPTT